MGTQHFGMSVTGNPIFGVSGLSSEGRGFAGNTQSHSASLGADGDSFSA